MGFGLHFPKFGHAWSSYVINVLTLKGILVLSIVFTSR